MTKQSSPRDEISGVKTRLLAISFGVVLLSACLLFALVIGPFERDLAPEMDAKIGAIQRSTSAELSHALDLGIPLDRLVGMPEYLNSILKANPELGYITVSDADGNVLFRETAKGTNRKALSERTELRDSAPAGSVREVGAFRDGQAPLLVNGKRIGTLDVAVPTSFVRNSMFGIVLDLAVALIVSLLATLEILIFVANRALTGPLTEVARIASNGASGDFSHIADIRTRDELGQLGALINGLIVKVNERVHNLALRLASLPKGAAAQAAMLADAMNKLSHFSFAAGGKPGARRHEMLTDIRAPLFLYVMAGEMSRSFFPNFVKLVYTPIPGLSADTVLGLPISAFMFMVAATTPSAGSLCERIGGRKLFLMSLVPTLIGLIGTGIAANIYQLLGFWAVNAIGYAMATIACQARIAESTSTGNRARGMSLFVTSIMVSAICGTSLGGVISDRIGFRPTFFLSAILVILAGAIVASVFSPHENKATHVQRRSAWIALKATSGNVRFVSLMVLGAIPAKIILAGFLYYSVPLYLAGEGFSQSTIGRVMMIYFVIMVFGSPLFARLADRFGHHLILVSIGGICAGAGAALLPYLTGLNGVLLAVVLLGIGHALGTAPLIALIPDICVREIRTVGQTSLYGVLRVTERVGSVLGPILAALVATRFSYAEAAQVIGLLVSGAGLLLLPAFWLGSGTASDTVEEMT